MLLALLTGCAPLAPLPGGELAFGVLGDTPYSPAEVVKLDALIDRMNAQELAFVVHLGDIGTGAATQGCSDPWLEARKRQFARLRHPFVLLPGDNEWSDCRDPLARLARWRALFCDASLAHQAGEYCEHLRWEAGGFVFVALNVPGGNNNVRHPEHAARMRAVFAWLDEAAALAEQRDGLVVLMQANPFVVFRGSGYAGLRERLGTLAARFPGKVTLIHGDTHTYRDDQPLPGLRRIEVLGSPFVGWLRGVIGGRAISVAAGP